MNTARILVIAVAATGIALLTLQAAALPIQSPDEILWLERCADAWPHQWRTIYEFKWAWDIGQVNRWAGGAALWLTGNRDSSQWPTAWRVEGWKIYVGEEYLLPRYTNMERFHRLHGRGLTWESLMTLRVTNLLFFAAALMALYASARMILRHRGLAMLCVLPFVTGTYWATRWATVPQSGDTQLMCFSSLALWVWLRQIKAGTELSRHSILILAAVIGLAIASKQTGVMLLLAYAGRLAWRSRGGGRLARPAMACFIGILVFVIVNPVYAIFPDIAFTEFVAARVLSAQMRIMREGPLGAAEFLRLTIAWWPLFPLCGVLAWRRRTQWWAGVLVLWAGVPALGQFGTMMHMEIYHRAYMAPIEWGTLMAIGILVLSDCPASCGHRQA